MDSSGDHKTAMNAAKAAVLDAVERCDLSDVELWLRRLWKGSASASLAAWTQRTLQPILGEYCGGTAKVAFLRSFTVEPAVQLLISQSLCERLRVESWVGQFNAYSQEILADESELYRFEPDIAVLAVLTRSIAPELWNAGLANSEADRQAVVDRVCSEFQMLFEQFRQRSDSTMLVHTLEIPAVLADGIGDSGRVGGQVECIEQINRFLREETSGRSGFCLLNAGRMAARYGIDRWYDEQRWNSIRMPMVGDAVSLIATEWLAFAGALTLPPRKVLVVDLDNTLWHGVIGEDGFDGIRMDESAIGSPHQNLQQVLLNLYHRGILLAVCSKNNHVDAWQVIEEHPDMLLKPEHLASVRINWQDKGTNIQEIARELNVGLDSVVFLDDNPAEQHLVRTSIPNIQVLDVGSDATEYAEAVRRVVGFERIRLTQDDQKRGQMYAQQRERRDLQASSQSLETYLESLQTTLSIADIDSQTIERVAQLTQKTNQFNLTTKRYSTQQIQTFVNSPDEEVLAVNVRDRFGDNGLVGVSILRYSVLACEIDTLLLSCRVIGRGVETAILSLIVESAVRHNCPRLLGQYVATQKNSPCADFLERHGFRQTSDGWLLEQFDSPVVQPPSWITMEPIAAVTED